MLCEPLILSRDVPSSRSAYSGFKFELRWHQHTLTYFGILKSKENKNHSEMPRSLPAATPTTARGKSKGNRSVRCIPGGNEAIWDDELHTALIEGISFWPPSTKRIITPSALNIYPPMGRQRIRPMHDGSEGRTSLGRCQLIQQYLIQRTGKNRTRKQISSRIQRLRRMHHDDPASMSHNKPLFTIELIGHTFQWQIYCAFFQTFNSQSPLKYWSISAIVVRPQPQLRPSSRSPRPC